MDSVQSVKCWAKQKLPTAEQVNSAIDEHVWVIRYLPYALGAAGLFVSFRAIRSATKFTHASQIPGAFVRKNAQLRGRLADVNVDGTLAIEHSPIFNLPWHRFNKSQYLDVRLAYTRPSVSGVYWLKLNAVDKPIKFRIISRRENELFVSLSFAEKPKLNLNEELVLRGLATFQPQTGLSNRTQRRTHDRLAKLQAKAQKNGSGIWETAGYKPSMWTSFVRLLSEKLKNRR